MNGKVNQDFFFHFWVMVEIDEENIEVKIICAYKLEGIHCYNQAKTF